ncbi:MAG: TetR family transcriptional regulator [Hyphomicrobiales bacterium]
MARKSQAERIIDTTLELAAERGWSRLKLAAIAKASGISLAKLHDHFSSKADILAAFMARIDGEVLENLDDEPDAGELPRDRIFEVVMRRLEILEPHKPALKMIAKDMRDTPSDWGALCNAAARSQRWMLAGAGLEDYGLRGFIKVNGLALVYSRVMRVWLEDDDPGLARTMAELDRSLRRGERALKRAETPIALATAFFQFGRAAWRQRGTGGPRPGQGAEQPGPQA